jgi:EEF1A N-terminal glycine/lysine methyltransferase
MTTKLTDLIDVIPVSVEDEAEDIFSSAKGLLFPDDYQTLYGDPGSTIVYKSKRFNGIELKTADPDGEDERRLFGHYLWNAGVKMAELISARHEGWEIEGETVLELGAGKMDDSVEEKMADAWIYAGVGLCGIVATLAGANEV